MNRIVFILLVLTGFVAKAQYPVVVPYIRFYPGVDTTWFNDPVKIRFPANTGGIYYNVTTGKMMYKDNTGYHKFGSGSGGGGGGGLSDVLGTTDRITSTGTTTKTINISSTFEALLGKVASPLSQFASTTSAQLGTVLSDETGSAGGFVRANTPTLITPILGTPTSINLLNATNLPSTGLATMTSAQFRAVISDEVGSGFLYTVGGALGTPASGTATNLTGLPITGITSSTSSQLATLLSDEVLTGPLYFGQPIEATTTTAVGITLSTAHYTEYSYSGLIRTTNTLPINITVPTNATAAIAIKTKIAIDNQGSDTVTVVYAGGVTHNDGGYVEIPPHSSALLYKVATNEWDLLGTGPGGSGGGGGGSGECLWTTSTTAIAHTFDTDDVSICNNSGIIRYTGAGDVNFTMPAFSTEAFESGTGIVVNNQSTTGTITIVFSGGITGGGHSYPEIGPGESGTLVNAGTDVWDLLGTKTIGETSWTSWTPTFTGFTGSVTGTARYKVDGNTLLLHVDMTGTSNAAGSTWTLTLPTGMTPSSNQTIIGQGYSSSAGVIGTVRFSSGISTVTVYNGPTEALAWGSSGTKGIRFNGLIEIN